VDKDTQAAADILDTLAEAVAVPAAAVRIILAAIPVVAVGLA
jgi:hypothetical protein